MNKLLILALLGFALIALTAGEEEDADNSLQSVQAEVQQLREVREADAKKNKETKSGKGKKKSGKGKKKSGKGKKKSGKGKKKSGKGKKKSGKGKKKSVKGKKKSGKGKKKSGKGKKKSGKGKKKSGKGTQKSGKVEKKTGNNRQATCNSDDACLANAIKYLKQMKDKAKNFQAQSIRMTKFSKLSSSKGGKKDIFVGIMTKLRESTGGNSSAPNCQGADNDGAKTVKTVIDSLTACSENIKAKCDTGAPTVDDTFISDCTTKIDALDKLISECTTETDPAKSCACWKADGLKTASDAIANCDLTDSNKEVTDYKKACTGAFAVCRTDEDNANELIFLCGPGGSPEKLLIKIKAITETVDALNELKTAADKAATKKAVARQSRATTCAEFTEKVKAVAAKAAEDPAATGLAAQIKAVAADPPATCSDAEKAALKATVADIDAAITSADEALTEAQEEIKTITGSTASPDAIAAATTAGPAVPTAAPGRKNIMKLKKLFQNW